MCSRYYHFKVKSEELTSERWVGYLHRKRLVEATSLVLLKQYVPEDSF